MIFLANVHSFGYSTYQPISCSNLTHVSVRQSTNGLSPAPSTAWGLVCLIFANALLILSTSALRECAHSLFKALHATLAAAVLLSLHLHVPALSRYVVAATLIWAFDLLLRAAKTRVQTARLVPLCAAQGLVRIELPRLNAGWRAGQHVRLRVLFRQMGWWGWAEAQPYTTPCCSASPWAGERTSCRISRRCPPTAAIVHVISLPSKRELRERSGAMRTPRGR
jgi:hypothetical protein